MTKHGEVESFFPYYVYCDHYAIKANYFLCWQWIRSWIVSLKYMHRLLQTGPYVVSSDFLPVSVNSCVIEVNSVLSHVYLNACTFVKAEYAALKMPLAALALSTFISNL